MHTVPIAPFFVATQTHIGLSIWSVAGAAAILGLAVWFVVIARDIPDDRPRKDRARARPSGDGPAGREPLSGVTAQADRDPARR